MQLFGNTPQEEIALRHSRIRKAMEPLGLDAVLISSIANRYYTTGSVVCGYVYIPAEGDSKWLLQRADGISGPDVIKIRKPEQIAGLLQEAGCRLPSRMGLELGTASYLESQRLMAAFPGVACDDCSAMMRRVRSVKTSFEIALTTASGKKHDLVYRHIPDMYQEGMTDIELQIEIERALRMEGCLGVMRTAGESMEIFMCNVLTGENADKPSPYDFAMGGAGLDPSLPVGACGEVIRPGNTVMVDANGNFTGYMTDMTRVFSLGEIPALAVKAHQCSIDICARMAEMAVPGTAASALYEEAVAMARNAGLEDYFMGHRQKAGFIGHGVGVELNELPVLSPRSRDVIAEGNVIALEPKFVIPRVGAVGIENTYEATAAGLRCLNHAPESIISLT